MSPSYVCLLAILLASPAVPFGAEVIRIQVVDGRNGKTITDEQLQVWINGTTKNALSLKPGPDGIAELEAPAGSSLKIESNLYKDCRTLEKSAARPVYSTDQIRSSGIATQNTCGKLRLEPRRGELMFFVRPLHWWEGMKR